ncbi:MAG: DNA repair exonuclease [Clostridia bacterium]|nr:DNA repair exonuclease [Clostridia bacterium]
MSIKIIHTADIHIGSALKGLPSDKSALRKAEILDGFRRLCTYAKETGVAAVLIAGDLFDENKTARHIRRETLAVIAAASPVRFFYASGNHDDEFDATDELPNNLFTFSQNHAFQSYELGGGIRITGIDTKNLSPAAFSTLSLSPENYNIVVMHGDINGEIPLPRLQNRFVDYLALGHIHKPMRETERLDSRGRYRYCGCLEGRGFDELGDRGFFLLEIADGALEREKFLSLATRKTVEARVDISACNSYFDVENSVLSALGGVSEKDLVKAVLCGRHKAGLRKDISLLVSRLNERFFFAKAEDESRIALDPHEFENDLTERGEFVREAGRYEMKADFLSEVLEVGLKALSGEEIDL